MYMEERIDFVASLPISAAPAKRSLINLNVKITNNTNKASACVFPNNISVRLPGVQQQIFDDVNLCKLVMQAAADKLFPEPEQIFEWYKYYTSGLGKLGWVLQARNYENTTIDQAGLTLETLALQLAKPHIGDKATIITSCFEQAMAAVKNTPGALELFNVKEEAKQNRKYDLGPVWYDEKGQANMVVNCISFDSREGIIDVLNWKSTTQSTTVKSGATHAYLDNNVFPKLRNTLVAKYETMFNNFVLGMPDF